MALIRIFNARFLTENDVIEGEMWIKDGVIEFLSRVSPLILLPWDREIDAGGNLIVPAFVNAHAHSPMVVLRSAADDLPLREWLERQVFPREAKLTPDDCYWLTKLAVTEYLRGGIGTAADMYFHLDAIAAACAECGFRNVLMEGITQGNAVGLAARLDDGRRKFDGMGGVVEYRVGIHAEYTNEESNLRAVAEYVRATGQAVYMHMSETAREVADCVAKYGKTPPRLAEDLGLFDNGGAIFHGVHLGEEDIEILARRRVGVVSCPASNLKLASGIAPLCRLTQKGITVGLGTDGAASNNALDMFREMYLAAVLQKYRTGDAAASGARTVADMATVGGARALGITDGGALAVGMRADMALIDLKKSNLQPETNLLSELVYAGGRDNVRWTMVGGKILYEDGQYFIGEDADKIYSECAKIAARVLA